jgi:hypothetical protein
MCTELQAVRQGKWKLHVPHPYGLPWEGPHTTNRHIAPKDQIDITEPMLIDLEADPGETTNVAAKHPDIVKRLLAVAEKAREDIGDHDRVGRNMRFFDPMDERPQAPLIKRRSEIRPAKR